MYSFISGDEGVLTKLAVGLGQETALTLNDFVAESTLPQSLVVFKVKI